MVASSVMALPLPQKENAWTQPPASCRIREVTPTPVPAVSILLGFLSD
jgi:hypothetical protein